MKQVQIKNLFHSLQKHHFLLPPRSNRNSSISTCPSELARRTVVHSKLWKYKFSILKVVQRKVKRYQDKCSKAQKKQNKNDKSKQ